MKDISLNYEQNVKHLLANASYISKAEVIKQRKNMWMADTENCTRPVCPASVRHTGLPLLLKLERADRTTDGSYRGPGDTLQQHLHRAEERGSPRKYS